MDIGNLTCVLDENRTTILRDTEGKEIARYDGKNSIPCSFVSWDVEKINIENGCFVITISQPE